MYAFLQQWDMAVIMLQIVAIDLLLGGDNAVVIAMACRKLPPQKRTKAIIIGTVGAIGARSAAGDRFVSPVAAVAENSRRAAPAVDWHQAGQE